jgi:uncharacterized protein
VDLPFLATLGAAFLAGLAGAGHCAGMCGGIAGAMHLARPQAPIATALVTGIGRISAYALAGALIAAPGLWLGDVFGTPERMTAVRATAGGLLILVGLTLLFPHGPMRHLERMGQRVWRRIQPLAAAGLRRGDLLGMALVSGLWGFLPCGLVYGMLIVAATTGDPLHGATLMLAFGIGTLPAVIAAGLVINAGWVRSGALRRVSGVVLIGLGIWTALSVPVMTSL